MHAPCSWAAAVAASFAAAAPVAAAPQVPDADVATGGTTAGRVRVRWENDSWFSSRDRFYTNGTSVGVTLPDGPLAAAFASSLAWLPFRAAAVTGTATELALSQETFTPEDVTATALVPDDRPYAGWLHVDLRHHVLALDRGRAQDALDTWLLQLGVVGPSSLAEQTQLQVHEVVGAPRPQGWANQLHDEPGIVLGFRRDFRAFRTPGSVLGLDADFEGHYALHVGNVDTSARLGALVRLGAALPRHFGTTISHPDVEQRARLWVEAGVEGRAVARDVFLDGNTWRNSHSVDRNALVADLHVALQWEPCWWARLRIARVFRTPEFDSPSRSDPSSFVSAQLELLW